jgi:beta-glucuronidase
MTDAAGRARFELLAPALQKWDLHDPKLYEVAFTAGTDSIHDRIGFRTIEVSGTDILLNGRSSFSGGSACMKKTL